MAADELVVTSPGPVMGEVVVRGRLVDREANRLAGFQQTTRIWRGSRVIELEIELDVEKQPEADPWKSYYAARFAWADDSANLYRSVNGAVSTTSVSQIESPQFVEVRGERLRTTFLTGGLPYHRYFAPTKLDTLLVVRGETARRFRLGIGIDLPNPMPAALDFLAPQAVQPNQAMPTNRSGWLFHLDARNVVATHWEPLLAEGRPIGFRVRLLETEGRAVPLGLRAFRAAKSAQKVGRDDAEPTELAIDGDCISVELGSYEWAEVEVTFA
jgi:alpha-mannosidase